MKHSISLLFVLLLTQHLCGQINVTWKGGTPGHKNDWNTSSNWSNNSIPDEFTDVMIPFDLSLLQNYPVIKQADAEVHSIWLHRGTRVNLSSGSKLTVYSVNETLMDPVRIGIYHSDISRENVEGLIARVQ